VYTSLSLRRTIWTFCLSGWLNVMDLTEKVDQIVEGILIVGSTADQCLSLNHMIAAYVECAHIFQDGADQRTVSYIPSISSKT